MPRGARRILLPAAFALAAAATVLPFFAVDFPPLVDLPQHEALVAALRHWGDPACEAARIYEVDRFAPYWLGYLLAWALSYPFGVGLAFKVVLALVLVAIPLLTLRLVRALGGLPEWALLAFPLGFGFATAWGLFSFLAALPLLLWLILETIGWIRAPRAAAGARLALLFVLLFFAHLLAFALGAALFAVMLAASWRGGRDFARRIAPLIPALALAVVWAGGFRAGPPPGAAAGRLLEFGWNLGRLTDLPRQLTGMASAPLATMAVLAAAGLLALSGAGWSRERARLVPFALLLAAVVLAPGKLLGTSYLPARYGLLLYPALLVALEARPVPPARRRLALAGMGALAFALLAAVAVRFTALDREGAGLDELLAGAPVGARLLYLPYDRGSSRVVEPVFAYSGSRYAVERCGVAEKSFASYYQLPIRFREGQAAPLPPFLEFVPDRFRWRRHGGDRFDLLLVRSPGPPPVDRITRGEGRLELVANRQRWWLYRMSPLLSPASP